MVQLGGGYNSIFGSADSLVGKFGTTANTFEMLPGGVGFEAGTPGIAGMWAYLAAVTKAQGSPFGANPHALVL